MARNAVFAGYLAANRHRTPPSTFPSKYGTIEGWWSPRDAATVHGSSPITALDDKSGNAHHLNVTTGMSTGRTLNGVAVLDAVPAAVLYCTGQTITSVNTGTWMAVYERDAGGSEGAWSRVFGFWKPGAGQDFDGTDRISAILRINSTSTFASYYNSAQVGGSTMAAGKHIVATRRNAGAWDMFLDGAHIGSQVTGLGSTAWATSVELGVGVHEFTHDNSDGSPDGGIGDIVWWRPALSDADVLAAMGDLNTVYGIY